MVTILEDLDVQQSIFLLFHVYSTFPNIRAQTRQSAQNARNRRVILPASRIDPIFFFLRNYSISSSLLAKNNIRNNTTPILVSGDNEKEKRQIMPASSSDRPR